jgi:effector-binding domain-containing protein
MTPTANLGQPEIVRLEPQPTVAVRVQQPMAELDLAAAFDQYLPMVAERVTAAGGELGGAPFGRYHLFGPKVVDLEIGCPVATIPAGFAPLSGLAAGEVGASELPGGLVARVIHSGSYDTLSAAYDALHDWIHAQPGVDDGAGPWESYVDDPSTVSDISALRTEITWPLRST